jgi:hypothetical protein
MGQIDTVRRQLEAADGLARVLDASWMAFEVLAAGCQQCQDGPRELFAAFAFAAAAAAEGMIVLAAAPSLPPGPPGQACELPADAGDAADALAGLARVLHQRLATAAGQAGDSPDAVPCAEAGLQAAAVYRLLAREP